MRPRISPAFVVAVLALVVAAGGTGYAAGKVTSRDIANGTVQSRDLHDGSVQGRDVKDGTLQGVDVQDESLTGSDVADGSLSGADLAPGSVPRSRLSSRCAADEAAAFGGCVRRTASGPTSLQAAIEDCNQREGRLPTTLELCWLAGHDEFTWADGDPARYEFSGDSTGSAPYSPIAFDRNGNAVTNAVTNAVAQAYWHHCVTG